MRAFIRWAAIGVTTTLIAVGCGGSDTSSSTTSAGASVDPASITGTIRLLSYSDGFDPGYLAAFEQMYPNITIESSSMGSNEEAIAKILAGFDADVVNSCVDEATLEMVEKGIYAPLDASRLRALERPVPVDADPPGGAGRRAGLHGARGRRHVGHRVQRRRRHDTA